MILKTRYVVPVDAPVIENAAVELQHGRIVAVGPARTFTAAGAVDYGDAVMLPGLVNAHTHLELTTLAGKLPPHADLIDWLRRLVDVRRAAPPTEPTIAQAMRLGITESLRSGTTTIGDITASPEWTRPVLAASPLRAVSFGEVIAIGTRRHRLADRLALAASTRHATSRLRVGISPHAPYTVEPSAMRACAARAATPPTPLCIHLAESPDEDAFTRTRTGPFVDHLRRVGVWDDDIPVPGSGPVELAHATGLLTRHTIVAHANYVSDADITLLAATGAAVAYCPRTHAAFHHKPHRFRDMLAAGVNVCIGTDSRASNPSLSILDELRYIRTRYPDLDPAQLVAMATIHGATALGLAETTGSITVGKAADLAILPIHAHPAAPWHAILDAPAEPIAVYIAGQPTPG